MIQTIDKLNKYAQEEMKFLDEKYKLNSIGPFNSLLYGLIMLGTNKFFDNLYLLSIYGKAPIVVWLENPYEMSVYLAMCIASISVVVSSSIKLIEHEGFKKSKTHFISRDSIVKPTENYVKEYCKTVGNKLNLEVDKLKDMLFDIDMLSIRLKSISEYKEIIQ